MLSSSAWSHAHAWRVCRLQVAEYYIPRMPPIDPAYPENAHRNWVDLAQEIIGDFVMRCPTRDAATALSEQGHDVFLYDFTHQPGMSVNWPGGTHNLGAFHGAEVPFVFHDDFELMGGEVNLSSTMSTYWTNMASSGDPNTWSGPTAADLAAGDEGGALTTARRRTLAMNTAALAGRDEETPKPPPSEKPKRTLRLKNHT